MKNRDKGLRDARLGKLQKPKMRKLLHREEKKQENGAAEEGEEDEVAEEVVSVADFNKCNFLM